MFSRYFLFFGSLLLLFYFFLLSHSAHVEGSPPNSPGISSDLSKGVSPHRVVTHTLPHFRTHSLVCHQVGSVTPRPLWPHERLFCPVERKIHSKHGGNCSADFTIRYLISYWKIPSQSSEEYRQSGECRGVCNPAQSQPF